MSDPALIHEAIIEAAARALYAHDTRDDDAWKGRTWGFETKSEDYFNLATTVLAAVTPLIRAEALEEAAQVAENHSWGSPPIGTAIRALKPASPSPSADSA